MSRSYVTAKRLAILAERLTDREREVLATLARLRLASASQLERLHFSDVGHRQARAVLASLVDRRLLARLPRLVGGVRAGSAGFVYALDVAGQRLLADGHRPQRPWPVGTPFLSHTLAISELFTRLVLAERAGELRLASFTTEPGCWRAFAGPGGGRLVLKPDAQVTLALGRFEDDWFIEVDRATESRPTLARKLELYRRYWQTGTEQARTGVFPRVLWLVPDAARSAVLASLIDRLPTSSQALFAVARYDDAVARLHQGAQP